MAQGGDFFFDSCAITSWNIGDEADPQMRRAAEKKGYSCPPHEAKLCRREFFQEFDYIFAATEEVYQFLEGHARTKEEKEKIFLATHFSSRYQGQGIPDPYRKEDGAFDAVLEMIEEIAKETLPQIK